MNIRQVNVTYFEVEDRLMLRLLIGEGDEFRFWLTRNCLKGFMPQAAAWLGAANASADAALQSFKREMAAASADLSTPFESGASFPLGEAPILVLRLRMESEANITRLILELPADRAVTLNLEEHAAAGIQRLLRETAEAAGWHLQASEVAPAKIGTLSSISSKLH